MKSKKTTSFREVNLSRGQSGMSLLTSGVTARTFMHFQISTTPRTLKKSWENLPMAPRLLWTVQKRCQITTSIRGELISSIKWELRTQPTGDRRSHGIGFVKVSSGLSYSKCVHPSQGNDQKGLLVVSTCAWPSTDQWANLQVLEQQDAVSHQQERLQEWTENGRSIRRGRVFGKGAPPQKATKRCRCRWCSTKREVRTSLLRVAYAVPLCETWFGPFHAGPADK